MVPSEMLVCIEFQNCAPYHEMNRELNRLDLDANLNVQKFR
jgi:hypothetical protein